MKVLHLGKLCPPTEGGIEVATFDLLKYLNNAGIKADLICFDNKSEGGVYGNFDLYSCKMNFKLRSTPLSFDFVKIFLKIQDEYDIIHVHSPNPLAELLSLYTRKKVIVHWHSDIVRQKFLYFFYKPFQQLALKKADRIVCTSPDYLNSSLQIRKFREKSVVIPLGLDIEKIVKSDPKIQDSVEKFLREKFSGKKIVLSIGRLVKYKGFEYLIRAGRYLGDDTVILIGGGGPFYKKLEEIIKMEKLEEKVFLLGRVENALFLIKNCDVFCLPSILRSEAFGFVLVEALYFGKPLITTKVEGSGMNYVNVDGVTGIVVPPRDSYAIAEAIKRILGDSSLYFTFSQNALERFKEFDMENIGKKVIKLYEEVLKC